MTQKHSVPEEPTLSEAVREQKPSGFALPELEHNLKLLIELTEQEILQVDPIDLDMSLNHFLREFWSANVHVCNKYKSLSFYLVCLSTSPSLSLPLSSTISLSLSLSFSPSPCLQSSRQLQYERDTVVTLTHESTTLQARLSEEDEALKRLEQVLEMVERFEAGEGQDDPPITLQECAEVFEKMQTGFYQEYKTLGLADLAVSVVHPLLKGKLSNWNPLKVSECCGEEQTFFDTFYIG